MNCFELGRRWFSALALAAVLTAGCGLLLPAGAHAQATISSGSIEGTVLDPNGATVASAKVTITSKATGQKFTPQVTSAGTFTSGSIAPGEYILRVEAPGFRTLERLMTVQIGQIVSGNSTLSIGESSTVVTVEGSAVSVNTEQASVQGVLTTQQIENLPINGRNFLDLAQLEPGVQIQDGANFDPTKNGFSSISFGGRFGRTARIEVDGVDISDETVGTTTTNIPASALQEFQLTQSSLDLSNELTSSGAVNVTTRSGSNTYHGQAFGFFRDSSMAASLPGNPPFQRSQFGGNFGGAIIKDKLFFFADGERTKQELFNAVFLPAPFAAVGGGYSTPYRESDLLGKVDYVATPNLKLFYRFSYFGNLAVAASSFSPFASKNYTRTHLVGGDWTTGAFTHSFRFQYLKFRNQIVDASNGLGLPNSDLGVNITLPNAGATFGPNILAPQGTPQSDRQFKYDGSRIVHNHVLRYGVSFNHLQGGGFAKFFSLGSRVINLQDPVSLAFAAAQPNGGADNPLNYPVEIVQMGNGLGFGTELKSFGFPAGGLGPDNRLGLYVGDSWKIKPNLTLSLGLRYVRDTGRTDSDIPALDVVNGFFPGLGDPVRQPNKNFAPQVGIAWDPFKSGKTVIRAGAGLFYENVIWNNVLFDRPLRLPSGAFFAAFRACNGIDTPVQIPFADGTLHTAPVGACGDGNGNPVSIAQAAPLIAQFSKEFQDNAAQFGLNAPNSGYLPSLLQQGAAIPPPSGFFAPDYQTPRGLQMNLGVQRQLWKGAVISADFIRNVGTHLSLGVDVNHVGDVRFFNLAAATDAIDRTNAGFGCGAAHDAASVNCAIAAGATMVNYARNGLGTPGDAGAGACTAAAGIAFQCAFAGQNPAAPGLTVQEPIGRSTYDALQIKYVQNVNNPMRGMRALNFQVSYSLSSSQNTGGFNGSAPNPSAPAASDLDFVSASLDNQNPFRFFGPSALDRTHQLSFGGIADLPGGFRAGIVGHFYSALPNTLFSVNSGLRGEIFRSDFTGDGLTADPLPGTRVGAFGRDFGLTGLTDAILNFDQTVANQPTPAGQVLVQNGLFTVNQLQSLNGVAQFIGAPPPDQVPMRGLKAFDFRFGWVHKFRERLSIEPSVSFYNLFNFANFDLPTASGGTLSGTLSGTSGSLNGTSRGDQEAQRVGSGSGVFSLGSPRVVEWGLKVTF